MARRSKKKSEAKPSTPQAWVRKAWNEFSLDDTVRAIGAWLMGATSGISWKLGIQLLIIVALGVWIYYPSLHGLYLWDDDFLLQQNVVVQNPNGIYFIWSDPEHALIDFFPLTVSAEWLIWQIFYVPDPTDPQFLHMTFYFHITSLIFHLINVTLVWYLFRKLGIRFAYLGALLFLVHPALVESVSWMAELKNTLAMPPFVVAMVAWINFDRTRRWEYYALALFFYLIALLFKSSVVMFPVIILLYAWWKHGRIGFWDKLRGIDDFFSRAGQSFMEFLPMYLLTSPFFLAAAFDAYYLIIYLRHGVGEQFIPGLLGGPLGRTACAGLSLIFYFSKCILPVNLLPIYPQWPVALPTDSNPIAWSNYVFYQAMAFGFCWPVLFFGFWWLLRRREQPWARVAVFGFGFFFFNILPFVGWRAISFMRFGWVMDHFLYVPILGLIGLAAVAASDIWERLQTAAPAWRIAAITATLALLATFTVGSHLYAEVFTDRLAYWTYETQHNYVAWPAHNNRGNQLLDYADKDEKAGYIDQARQEYTEAKNEFKIALALNPVYTEAYNNLGYILTHEGDYWEAEKQFRTSLSFTPDFESAQLNLAHVLRLEQAETQAVELARQGKYKEAEAIFRQILQVEHDDLNTQHNLARVLQLEAAQAQQPQAQPQPQSPRQ